MSNPAISREELELATLGVEYNLLTTDAQVALTEFNEDFTLALTQLLVEPWAKTLGLSKTSRALKTTYPIPTSAAGYNEFKGDIKYRSLFEKSLSLVPKTWQDGVAELASVIEAPDFVGWPAQPAAMAAAAQSLPNEIIAAALEANAVCWDGKDFFAGDHPINVVDDASSTYDNDSTYSGDLTVDSAAAALETALVNFDSMKAPNGKPMGLRGTHVLHPPSQRWIWKKVLEQDRVIQAITTNTGFGAVDNIFKNVVIPVCSYELTSSTKFYVGAFNKPGMYPWIVQDQGTPEAIISDKSSALYQSTLKLGLAYILRGNGILALPHCMQRFDKA